MLSAHYMGQTQLCLNFPGFLGEGVEPSAPTFSWALKVRAAHGTGCSLGRAEIELEQGEG